MKIYSSRILPLACIAVLVLGACGGDESTGDGPIDSPGEQPAMRAPTPIQVVGGGDAAGNLAAAASEDAPASSAASSDMMIAPAYWVSEYVAGEGLPSLPTDGSGYVFDANRVVTADQVAQLAAALGVEGEPGRMEEQWGTFWRVGPDDGSGSSLSVSEDGQQAWNYNAAWQEREAVMGCAVSVDSDGNESEHCPEVEPPVGVPSQAEAEQQARDLMASLGEDTANLTVESYGDEWFASVTFRDATDARASLREWNFGFGAEGVLQHAAGALAEAEAVGPYPLIDLGTALSRLNDQNYWFGSGGGGGLIEPGIAVAEAPPADLAVESGEVDAEISVGVPESQVGEGSSSGSTEGSEGGADGSTESVIVEEPMPVEPDGGIGDGAEPLPVEPDVPMPVEPMPEPEPVVVTLVDVQADLWWAWDVDGSVWLLPAYRFIDADGGWHTIPAVTDEFMIEAEPPVFVGEPVPAPEPMPVEVEPVPAEPAPEPDSPEPIDEDPDLTDPDGAVVELNAALPLPLEEFIEQAAERGFSTRIVMQDGESLAVTADFSESRLNVAAEGDTVVAVQSIG